MKKVAGVSVLAVDGAIFALTAVNTVFWGLAVKQLKGLNFSAGAIAKMAMNHSFDLAMISGLLASVASYYLLSEMGLTSGRFFSAIGFVAVVATNYTVFKDHPNPVTWLGVGLVLGGVVVLGLTNS